jgi:hypothetical protein
MIETKAVIGRPFMPTNIPDGYSNDDNSAHTGVGQRRWPKIINRDIGRMTHRRASRANSTDVARLAGVSIAAVSRAFKWGSSISPETAEKVFLAARQVKNVPNTLASSLITQQTNIVALMLANLNNPIYSSMLDEASRRLEAIGKQGLLFTPRRSLDFDDSLQRMLNYQADAIVIAAASRRMNASD